MAASAVRERQAQGSELGVTLRYPTYRDGLRALLDAAVIADAGAIASTA